MPKLSLIVSVFITSLSLLIFSPHLTLAQNCDNPQTTEDALRCGSSNSSGVPVTQDPARYLDNVLRDAINYLSIAVGIVAVILIIFAGYRYITSGGDASKVATAKNALVYAIVGLIIVALAQLIVRFVINEVKSPATNNPPASPSPSPGPPPSVCSTPPCPI